ncbi:MAG: hypothetical protein IKN41_07240, partial [Candidatus Methanomethylophilaceae archaeon]|nr:hypothetical protein [Candidatus Methanomethylophilaceae archaeon]
MVWKNGDTVLQTDNDVPYGTTPFYHGVVPTKDATAQFTYTFTGWDPAITPLDSDRVYTAQFSSTVNTYTVTFQTSDMFTLSHDGPLTVEYGTEFHLKLEMSDGYKKSLESSIVSKTVGGVTSEISRIPGEPDEFVFTVEGETYISVSEPDLDTFVIVWKYWDAIDHLVTYEGVGTYGILPDAPSITQVFSDVQNTYSFTGWSPAVVAADDDAEYTAQYSQTVNQYELKVPVDTIQYEIVLKDSDGNVIPGRTNLFYDYGSVFYLTMTMKEGFDQSHPVLTKNGVPMTPSESVYTLTLDGTVSVGLVGAISLNIYTVTWYEEDGTTEFTKTTVEHGSAPVAPSGPSKSADVQYTYSFKEWVPDEIGGPGLNDPATGDEEFKATYTSTLRSYGVSFQQSSTSDFVFTAISPSMTVDYGTDFEFKLHVSEAFDQSLPDIKVYAEWGSQKITLTKTGVTQEGDYLYSVTVQGTTKITLDNITRNTYTVKWNYIDSISELNVDNWVYVETEARHGQTPEPPSSIVASVQNTQYTKKISGWDSPLVPATGDMEYTAVYDTEVNKYTLTLPSPSIQFTITLEKVTPQGPEPAVITGPVEYGTEFIITIDLDEKFDRTLIGFLKNGTPISDPAVGHKSDHFTILGNTDIGLNGNIAINTYEVKWYSEGVLLATEERQYGYETAYPGTSNPTKESTASHVYTFNRWVVKDTEQDIPATITDDWEFEAEFTESDRYYDVTFQTSTGEFTIESGDTHVKYNDSFTFTVTLAATHSKSIDTLKAVPVIANVPGEGFSPISKEGNTATFTYTVQNDVRFNFDGLSINKYDVTWQYKTGPSTEGQTVTTVVNGVPASPPASVPTVISNDQYTWTLSGWSPAPHPIASDGEVFTAQYIQTVNKYTLKIPESTPQFTITLWEVTPQGNVPAVITGPVEYGTEFVITIDLDVKFNRSSVGFLKNGTPITPAEVGSKTDNFTILGNTDIGLNGNIAINTYEVKWYSEGVLLATEERQYGYETAYPGTSNPTKESTASHVYSFNRWVVKDTELDIPAIITADGEFEAEFTESDRYYDVTFQTSTGEFTIESGDTHVKYNDSFTFTVTLADTHSKSIDTLRAIPVVGDEPGAPISPTSTVGKTATFTYAIQDDIRFNFTGLNINTYEVTWKYNTDPSTEEQTVTSVVHGIPAAPPAAIPSSYSNDQYTWTLSGWSPAPHPITSDGEVFTAQYARTVNEYTLTVPSSSAQFTITLEKVTPQGNVPAVITGPVEYGTEFVITVDLDEKFDKTLVRFLKNGTPISEPAAGHKSDHFTVLGDTTIVLDGNISINTYEVKWYSEGTLLFTEERQHGYNTAYPGTSNPTKESTASHTYTFSRWVLKGTQQAIPLIITEDSEFEAEFIENDRTYHIALSSGVTYTIAPKEGSSVDTVYGHDFTFVFTTLYEITKFDFYIDGVPIARPTSVGGDQYEYTVSNVVKDILISVADNSSSQYDVVWKNSDGTTLYMQKVGHNELSAYPGSSNPEKQPTAANVFIFTGWLPQTGEPVTSDMEFVAQYKSLDRYYDVTFQSSDGEFSVESDSTHVKYNDTFNFTVTLAATHTKSIDTLKAIPVIGNVPGEEISPVSISGNVATFTYTVQNDVRFNFDGLSINKYEVTWHYMTGPSTEAETMSVVVHGVPAAPPAVIPSSYSNDQYTWTLTGWSPAIQPITSDGMEFEAQYSSATNVYSLKVPTSSAQFTVTLEKVTPGGNVPVVITDNMTAEYGTAFVITVVLDGKFDKSTVGFLKNGSPITDPAVGSKTDSFTIYGDTIISLNADISLNFYEVKWYNGSTLLYTESVPHGYNTTYPGTYNPTKESTASHVYTFNRWVQKGTELDVPAKITQDSQFEAEFTEGDRYYDVTFQTSTGEFTIESGDTHVKYNDTFTFTVSLANTHS